MYGYKSLLFLIPCFLVLMLSRVGFGKSSIIYPTLTNCFRREVFNKMYAVLGFIPEIFVCIVFIL